VERARGGAAADAPSAAEAAARAQAEADAAAAAAAAEEAATAEVSAESARDEEARSLFEAGRSAFADGRYEDALGDFQRAYELSGRAALLYNVGTTADRLRESEAALAAFERYLVEVPDPSNRAEVEARVRHLRQEVEQRAADQAAAAAAVDRGASRPTGGDPTLQIAGLTTLGVGAAMAIVGAIFGGLALDANGALERDRASFDRTQQESLVAQIDRDALVCDVLLAIGGAAVIAGGVMTVLGFTSGGAVSEEERVVARWSIDVGLGGAELRVDF
jgi:tetratricopeptide (TPR) repeat protein